MRCDGPGIDDDILNNMSRTRAAAAGLLVGLLAFGTVACGDDGGSATTIAEVANPEGKSYTLAQTSGVEVPAGVSIDLRFEKGAMSHTGACNSGGGDYSVANSKLVVPQMAMTEKACDEALMTFDDTLMGFLTSSPGIVIVGDVMTLQNNDITITWRESVPVRDAPLEGTTWSVTGTVEGDDTQSLQTDPATIVLRGGTADVFAGCNTGTATYTVQGDVISWGPLLLTKKACGEVANKLEGKVIAVLQGDNQFDIEATKLVLIKGAGGLTLVAG